MSRIAVQAKRQDKIHVAATCGCAAHTRGRKAVAVDPETKTANLHRLRRIEGQVRGLQGMVADERYCADILVQISSVQEALRAVSKSLLRNHLRHCATQAIRKGTAAQASEMYNELVDLIQLQSR
jgi:CsoR family transcriptional regulator, copper-sensing transcriptional repressor